MSQNSQQQGGVTDWKWNLAGCGIPHAAPIRSGFHIQSICPPPGGTGCGERWRPLHVEFHIERAFNNAPCCMTENQTLRCVQYNILCSLIPLHLASHCITYTIHLLHANHTSAHASSISRLLADFNPTSLLKVPFLTSTVIYCV